ncbi:hypothetical protein C8J56DRAFT_103861 [Mycena floridula]|nr:hypothetical protein C8J56DRAFT_103861 [Mycena floridula]
MRFSGSPNQSPFTLQLFQNVTHLELCNVDRKSSEIFNGKQLHSLTKLTHLSLTMIYTHRFEPLLRRLHLADTILVCIVYAEFNGWNKRVERNRLGFTDPRLVFARGGYTEESCSSPVMRRGLRYPGPAHYIRQWARPRGLDEKELDMWDEAEEIVQFQRANLEPRNSFFLSFYI